MPDTPAQRSSDHGGDVGVDFGVQRNGVDDHMHFVVEAFGEQGRIGRSIRREVRVSSSEGLASRLKKLPGILPAA
jgi:hypothetical protein